MLARVARQTTPGAGPLQARAAVGNSLRPTAASLLKTGHGQQIRTFRFGMWSSYLDPEFQREMRHRQRSLKHKYAEALNRRLPWDQYPVHGHPKAVVKHMLRRYWNPARAKIGSRFSSFDDLHGRQQQGPAADNGDMHTGTSWAHGFWWGGYSSHYASPPRTYKTWKSQLDDDLSRWAENIPKRKARKESSHYSTKSPAGPETTSSKTGGEQATNLASAEEYIIDPITNRKVPRSTYGFVEDTDPSLAESFRAYRAQFAAFAPPKDDAKQGHFYSDGPPPPAELKEYGQVNIDHVPSESTDNVETTFLEDGSESYRHPNLQDEYALNHLPPEESAEEYDDLDKYQAYEQDGSPEQVSDSTAKYEDLDKYNSYTADEIENAKSKQTPQYDDLNEYVPYQYQEDNVKVEQTQQYEDLDKYKHYNDEGKLVDSPIPKYEDLNKYNTADFQDSPAEEQPFQQYGDLEKYRTYRHQELDKESEPEQDIVAESLREFDAQIQEVNSAESLSPSIANELQKPIIDDITSTPSYSAPAAPPVNQSDRDSAAKTEAREVREQSMASHIEASDAVDREASSHVKKLRASSQGDENPADHQHNLTGNYVRDFPEDFSGSWSSQASHPSPEPDMDPESRSLDQKTTDVQAAEKHHSDQLFTSMNSLKLETSLDRQQAEPKPEPSLSRQETQSPQGTLNHHSTAEAEVDPYSREPQGLETSYTRECDGDASPTFIKTYGGEPLGVVWENASTEKDLSQSMPPLESLYHRDPEIDGLPKLPSELEPKADPEKADRPTVYKVLAYDPDTQKITVAETTSVVPDQATPLTPAEVMLRLTNPIKFLPHFAQLQDEGFEIVSGSGNVIVFRQVRPGDAIHTETSTPVNPIDMMGKSTALPNAAAFVSPTGFVNYDMPQVEEETQAAPFRSNIDVRREEPVFSGPKTPTLEELRKQKKKNVGRRVLLGGAWVAGLSYALGVVSEYFLTGGADGRGPTGF
ncbi:hypothetical protein GGR52DRAFT_158729 [Hypoxylon sp. FL1284]|nr:hypothetical protein GGR52DRAFT_158729 [Hypoxylon sp. FL1284]